MDPRPVKVSGTRIISTIYVVSFRMGTLYLLGPGRKFVASKLLSVTSSPPFRPSKMMSGVSCTPAATPSKTHLHSLPSQERIDTPCTQLHKHSQHPLYLLLISTSTTPCQARPSAYPISLMVRLRHDTRHAHTHLPPSPPSLLSPCRPLLAGCISQTHRTPPLIPPSLPPSPASE